MDEIKEFIITILKENKEISSLYSSKVEKVYLIEGKLQSYEKDFWESGRIRCVFLMVNDPNLGIQLFSRQECDLAFIPLMDEKQVKMFISEMFYGRANFYDCHLLMNKEDFINKIGKYLSLL